MKFTSIKTILALTALGMAQVSFANGAKTYETACASCHASGVNNAPKLGDTQKWKPLISEGQVALTAQGYVGIRGMPARGGKPDLSVAEFADAVVYMVNNSGGAWPKPDAKMLEALNARVARLEARRAKSAPAQK